VVLVTHAHLAPSLKISKAIPLLPSLSVVTCYGETLHLLLTYEVHPKKKHLFEANAYWTVHHCDTEE